VIYYVTDTTQWEKTSYKGVLPMEEEGVQREEGRAGLLRFMAGKLYMLNVFDLKAKMQ